MDAKCFLALEISTRLRANMPLHRAMQYALTEAQPFGGCTLYNSLGAMKALLGAIEANDAAETTGSGLQRLEARYKLDEAQKEFDRAFALDCERIQERLTFLAREVGRVCDKFTHQKDDVAYLSLCAYTYLGIRVTGTPVEALCQVAEATGDATAIKRAVFYKGPQQ